MINETELATCVRRAMDKYFKDLDGEEPTAIYNMVLHCIEKPLLEFVLQHAAGNQTLAADMLGLNRNTLRKKMKLHKIK